MKLSFEYIAIAKNFQFCSDLVAICTYVERIGRTYIFFFKYKKKVATYTRVYTILNTIIYFRSYTADLKH